jgi:predicted ribosome quality control (RQC) complex YloA/Tae2 family protein
MSLNWKEIDAVLEELSLEDSFIQGVIQPSFDSIALYTYKTSAKTVLIHLAPGVCRIHETRQKIPKTEKPLRFMEFLKSRVKGAKITECAQIGRERIIKIVCTHADEKIFLYVRLWSNAANIIATDDAGTILDTLYRRPKKGEVTGEIFFPPEPRDAQNSREYVVRDFAELTGHSDFAKLTLNQKIDLWYGEYADKLSREALLAVAEKRYTAQKSRMESALTRLEAKRADFLHAGQWKHQGDLILSCWHASTTLSGTALTNNRALVPERSRRAISTGASTDSFLECVDYETGQPVSIKIDPKKSAQANAAMFYAVYKKAMSGIEELEHDIARAKKELLDVDELYNAVLREQNPIRMQQLIFKQNQPKQLQKKTRPGVTYDIHGWTIFAGRTASENDALLRRHVKGQDLWLHTRDWAGGYIFIKNKNGNTVPLDILLYAGNLALYHSKARNAGEADLYYTQVTYLRRANNAPKGTVLPTHEKNLFIKRDADKLKKLEECIVE